MGFIRSIGDLNVCRDNRPCFVAGLFHAWCARLIMRKVMMWDKRVLENLRDLCILKHLRASCAHANAQATMRTACYIFFTIYT